MLLTIFLSFLLDPFSKRPQNLKNATEISFFTSNSTHPHSLEIIGGVNVGKKRK